MERTNSGVVLLGIYLLLAVYLVPLYPDAGSASELADWATVVALVENNSFNVAPISSITGLKLEAKTEQVGDAIYSTKAPGLAMLSAPFYAMTRLIVGAPHSGNVVTSWYVLRIVFGVMPLFLLAYWLYNREVDSYSLGVLLFATPIFAYSLVYAPFVFSAILVYMAFRMLWDPVRVMPGTCFSAAFLLGVAALCNYTAFVPMFVFGIALLSTERIERLRRIIFFLAGIMPPIGLLLIHQYALFGNPFAFVAYAGFGLPDLNSLYTFLVSPGLGLLVFSPILIFGVLAFFSPEEAGSKRHFVKICAILLTLAVLLGIDESPNSWTVGPKRMILIMPLLLDSFFDGEIEEYPSHWRSLIFSMSFALCTIPVVTSIFAPVTSRFPHNSFWKPELFDNSVYATTLVNTYGLPVSHWTILPVPILLALALFFVWRDSKFPIPFALGTLAGLGLVALYMFAVTL